MQTRNLAIALLLVTSIPMLIGGGGCGGTSARKPGKGKIKAIEDAPGSYVKAR